MLTVDEKAALDSPELLRALKAVTTGDFTVRLPLHWTGLAGRIADTFNEMVEMNQRLAAELARISVVVGEDGKIHERASLGPVAGSWAGTVTAVNSLVANLAQPTA